MKARPGRFVAVRWKDGKVFADAAGEVGAAYAAQEYRDRYGETTAVVRDGKLVRLYTVPAKNPRRNVSKRRNPVRSARGWKVSRGDLGPTGRCVSCNRRLGQLHGKNCRIVPRNNPHLAIFGANPKARIVKELGKVVEVRYKRQDDGGFYKHTFRTRPRLTALSDGSLWIRP